MNKLTEKCPQRKIRNVLLFFFRENASRAPSKINENFTLIPLDYSKKMQGNYIEL